jgi:hypothetical protein
MTTTTSTTDYVKSPSGIEKYFDPKFVEDIKRIMEARNRETKTKWREIIMDRIEDYELE